MRTKKKTATIGAEEYGRLVTTNLRLVYHITHRMRRYQVVGVEPEDVAQEIIHRLLKRRHLYRVGTDFGRWIYRAANNVCYMLRRSRGWGESTRKVYPNPLQITDEDERHLYAREEAEEVPLPACRRRVRRVLLALRPTWRRALLYKFWAGRKLRDVDRDQGKRVGRLDCHLNRAKRRLREILGPVFAGTNEGLKPRFA